MNLNGIGNGIGGLRLPHTEPRTRVEQDRGPGASPVAIPSSGQGVGRTQPLTTPKQDVLPLEAPEGTDPELWSVLTSEERAFFAKVGAMGPLTYGHIMTSGGSYSADVPVKRGGRLDVRI